VNVREYYDYDVKMQVCESKHEWTQSNLRLIRLVQLASLAPNLPLDIERK
jgi:hypothetical protein